jgi:hypothetical protein
MKRIVIYCCLFFLLLAGNQLSAQDAKVKAKEDKTKIKEGDDSKVKNKDDKTKIKEADYKEKDKDDKMKMKDGDMKVKVKGEDGMNMAYPYTATYSSNFIMGNPAHSKMILDLWKDWDDNAFDRHDYWADTVVMYTPDGTVLKGKSGVVEGGKKFRGGLKSVTSTVDAWMPLKSTDRNEDWVAIWGTETDTWPDGKVDTYNVHEVWRINKDGKIDLMRQFTSKMPQK